MVTFTSIITKGDIMGIIIDEILDLDNLEFTEEEIQTGAELLLGSEEQEDGKQLCLTLLELK